MELCFSTGNVIYVYGDMDEDGFYMGELNGVRGLVPSNFLTEAVSGDNVRHVSVSLLNSGMESNFTAECQCSMNWSL